jgi:hypothetical protein
MSENLENNNDNIKKQPRKEYKKRVKKEKSVIVKEYKKLGRPKKYEEGYNDHKFRRLLVDRNEYKRLIEIEKKYMAIIKLDLESVGKMN